MYETRRGSRAAENESCRSARGSAAATPMQSVRVRSKARPRTKRVMSAAQPLPYGFTVNRLNDHPPALGGRRGGAGEGRKVLMCLAFVDRTPVTYARQCLAGVSLIMP